MTIHLPTPPGFGPGSVSVELDGNIILDIADRLRMDPGTHFEIGPGGDSCD